MKTKIHAPHHFQVPPRLRQALAALLVGLPLCAPSALAQTCTILNNSDLNEASCWFRPSRIDALTAPSLGGSTGAVELAGGFFNRAPHPALPVYEGASLTWTGDHLYLVTFGGGTATTELFTPQGQPIREIEGVTVLASAFRNTFQLSTGNTIAVAVEAAAYVHTSSRVYLVLVGGAAATIEVTKPGGLPLGGVQGVSVLGGRYWNNSTQSCAVQAVASGGALLFTDTDVYLHLVGGGSVTTEVRHAGARIAGTRGVVPMANIIPPPTSGGMEAAAHLWTDERVYLVLLGGALNVSEISAPSGGPLSGAWGVVRLDGRIFQGPAGNLYQGAAQILTRNRVFAVVVGGGAVSVEVRTPSGLAIQTGVELTVSPWWPTQSHPLHESLGIRNSLPGVKTTGTIVGLNTYSFGS